MRSARAKRASKRSRSSERHNGGGSHGSKSNSKKRRRGRKDEGGERRRSTGGDNRRYSEEEEDEEDEKSAVGVREDGKEGSERKDENKKMSLFDDEDEEEEREEDDEEDSSGDDDGDDGEGKMSLEAATKAINAEHEFAEADLRASQAKSVRKLEAMRKKGSRMARAAAFGMDDIGSDDDDDNEPVADNVGDKDDGEEDDESEDDESEDDGEGMDRPGASKILGRSVEGDTKALRRRIQQVVRVLQDFKNLREPGVSRSTYTSCLGQDLSLYYGYNMELIDLFMRLFRPAECYQFLEANEAPRAVVIRTNTLKCRRGELVKALEARGVKLESVGDWSKVALKIYESAVPMGATPEYLGGHYMLQVRKRRACREIAERGGRGRGAERRVPGSPLQ